MNEKEVKCTTGTNGSMAILKYVVALLLLVTFRLSDAEMKLVCEEDTLEINCDEGKIMIIHALYGRNNNESCPGRPYQPSYLPGCASGKSMEEVRKRCDNKYNCSVPANNTVFGDPCPHIFKYLEVEYSCDCPRSVVIVGGVTLTFPAAGRGEQSNSVERCLDISSNLDRSLGTRFCGTDSRWAAAELGECYGDNSLGDSLKYLAQINVTEQNVNEVALNLMVASRKTDEITPAGLESIITILSSIDELGTSSEQVTDAVVDVVNNVMTLDEDTLLQASNVSEIVALLENQVARVHQNEQNYTESGSHLEVSALQLEKESLADGFIFDEHFTEVVNISDDEMNFRWSSIFLPPSILDIVQKVYPNISLIPITFITYLDARLFQSFDEVNTSHSRNASLLASYVDSHVITANIDLDDIIIKDLLQNSSVLINFSSPIIDPKFINGNTTVEFLCVYWEYIRTVGRGRWLQEGCTKVSKTDQEILCSCNHLTSFAILVTVHHSADTPEAFRLSLHVLTLVGGFISVAGLSISVLFMLCIRTLRQKQQTHVHLNLCLALLGLYLSFLFGIDRADHPNLCKVMTTLIYFFCLSSMAWMSVEAFYIYMLIWRYKQSRIRHLITAAAPIAWGLPAIPSLLAYFVFDKHDYITDPDYCFLRIGYFLYFGFIVSLSILFIYNSIVFTLATYRVSCRKIQFSNNDDTRDEITVRVKSIFLFWILLGISWLFGFLATIPGPLNLVNQVVFCLLFSFQGFFMFCMLVLQNPDMKRNFMDKVRKGSSSTFLLRVTNSYSTTKKESAQDHSADPSFVSASYVNEISQ